MVGWSLPCDRLLLGMSWPTIRECAHERTDHWISWLLQFTRQKDQDNNIIIAWMVGLLPFLFFHPWDQRNIVWSMEKESAKADEHGRRRRGRIQNDILYTCIHRASRAPWSMVYCLVWLLFMLIEGEGRGPDEKIIPRDGVGSVRAIWISPGLPCRVLFFCHSPSTNAQSHQRGWVRLREQYKGKGNGRYMSKRVSKCAFL